MKHPILFIAWLLAMAACTQPNIKNEPAAQAAENTAVKEQTTPPDSAAMMKAWTDYATPGAMHSMLAKLDGEWNGDITIWMDPAKPPTHSTGTAVYRMIFGGLYQESTHTSSFNGMAFEGREILGFDNIKKKFVSTWVDNMGSGIMLMEGTWDDATRTMSFTGKQVDPATGVEMDVRETIKIVDDNTQEVAMFAKYPGGEEFKTMEIKSKRKQQTS